jgi:hypothetical protein
MVRKSRPGTEAGGDGYDGLGTVWILDGQLRRLVGARASGPGRFSEAVVEAARQGRIRRLPKGRFAPVRGDKGNGPPAAIV